MNCEFVKPKNYQGEIPEANEYWQFTEMICVPEYPERFEFIQLSSEEDFIYFDRAISGTDVLLVAFFIFLILALIFSFIFRVVYPYYFRYINKKFR